MKIFYMGKQIQPNQHTKWYHRYWTSTVNFAKRAFQLFVMGSIGASLVLAGVGIDKLSTPSHVKADQISVEIKAPIMDRIAGCESEGNPKSKGTHYGTFQHSGIRSLEFT